MKILFVATRKNVNPDDRELYEMQFMTEALGFQRSILDLGILTVAACTPKGVDVEIVDEYFDDVPYDTDADLVALSAKTSCVTHAYAVAARFKAQGKPVVLGGIHASLRPQEALEHVDFVVTGEAELVWPQFVEQFRKGEAPKLTKAGDFPPMGEIPFPDYANLDPGNFLFHQIQTTRGCPFMCRFCSVPDIAGNTFRFKPVDRVVEEIRQRPKAGLLRERMKAIYFVDDNFISRTKYTNDLLDALIPLYEGGELEEWSAETTLNVVRDEAMLEKFARAGCSTLIIGFESISEATLLSMNKKVNFCLSYPAAIEKIHKLGMAIVGNFIVGFDTDPISVFRDIRDFVDDNNILYPFYSILTPMPGTKLHDDYVAEDRLDHTNWQYYDTRHVVFEPKLMSREQLMDGYVWLYEQSYASDRALKRLENYWRQYRQTQSTFVEHAFIKWRLRKFMKTGSPRFQHYLKKGWEILKRKDVTSDVGQLLYYYDAAHFCDFLDGYRSPNFAENARVFEHAMTVPEGEDTRQVMQWDTTRVKKTEARLSGKQAS
jgi:radical SAM superfamily enzyme YgiQ (UPF0313 family)